MHLIDSADLVVCQFRFRELPDADMSHFVDYLASGQTRRSHSHGPRISCSVQPE